MSDNEAFKVALENLIEVSESENIPVAVFSLDDDCDKGMAYIRGTNVLVGWIVEAAFTLEPFKPHAELAYLLLQEGDQGLLQ